MGTRCRCGLGPNGEPTTSAPSSHPVDQPLHSLVVGPEGVLAEHRALRLIVELEVYPVDGEVTPPLLGLADELAPQARASGLRRDRLGLEDLQVGGHPRGGAALLEHVLQPAVAADVVVSQVELCYTRVTQRQPVLGAV